MKILRTKTYSEYGKLRLSKAMTGLKRGLIAGAALSAIPTYSFLKHSDKNKKMGYAGLAVLGGGTLAGGIIGATKGLKTANESIKYLKALESDPNFVTVKSEIIDLRKRLWKFDENLDFYDWLKENDKALWEVGHKYPGLFMEMDVLIPEVGLNVFSTSPDDLSSLQKEGFLDIHFRFTSDDIFKGIVATYNPKKGKYEIWDNYYHANHINSKKLTECNNLVELKKELVKFLSNIKQTSTNVAAKESIERVGNSEKEWMEENLLDITIKDFKSIREKLLKRVDQYTKEIINAINKL